MRRITGRGMDTVTDTLVLFDECTSTWFKGTKYLFRGLIYVLHKEFYLLMRVQRPPGSGASALQSPTRWCPRTKLRWAVSSANVFPICCHAKQIN